MSDNHSEDTGGRDFSSEFHFSFSRASGPGGQNVNKVNTKVELRFDVRNSILLTEEEKELVGEKLENRINAEGELVLTASSERTQAKNKALVIERFYLLLEKALTPEKKRKPSRPSRASKEERLKEKKLRSEKKKRRSDDDIQPE